MRNLLWKLSIATGFALCGLTLAPAADENKDDKKTEKKADDKPADWSAFARGPVVVGEVAKINKNGSLIVKVQKPGAKPGTTEEMQWEFAEGGLLRWKDLPPKVDENGKKKSPTYEERQARKTPKGVPGYSAETEELQVGHIVSLELVRPKDVPASKALPQDFKIKYATIVGMGQGPSK